MVTMAQSITCRACGKSVAPDSYCSRCGTGLDDFSQEKAAAELSASTTQHKLATSAADLKEFAANEQEEKLLDEIAERIRDKDISYWIDDKYLED